MKKVDETQYKLERRMWLKKAKEKGFLIYTDSNDRCGIEVELLEKQLYKNSSVFVERIDGDKYQTHYTKWGENGEIEKVTMLNEGSFEKCLKKAVQFIKWLEDKKNEGGKKSE